MKWLLTISEMRIFAQQKFRMGLFVCTIGIARGMANLAYNLTRFVWHQGRTAFA
ncbi:hypothetical protein [Mesorhizobium caraganae]|uniref:hypothetical protein n=1 Tax=Mesorhizobium caraganae TaxID=483206 RepID=UPI00193948B5